MVVIVGLAWLASHVWGRCAVGSEVAGDSFVPLECGRRLLETGFARPSQMIFGWGLCASYAPLFIEADSLWTVAWRRAMVAAALVPGTYLFIRLALPSVLRVSPFALRTAALCCALLIHQNARLGTATSSGGHGYLAFSWVLVCFVGVAIAIRYRPPEESWRRRAPGWSLAFLAAAVAYLAAPMAAMNHPDAAWIGLTLLGMLPLFIRRLGWIGTALAAAPGLAAAWPRVQHLRGMASDGTSFGALAYQPGDHSMGAHVLIGWLTSEQYWPLTVGIVGITVLSLFWSKGREQRWTAASWMAGSVGAAVGLVILGKSVGYLQDYHALLAFPLAVLGLALVLARLCDVVARLDRLPAPGVPAAPAPEAPSPPPDAAAGEDAAPRSVAARVLPAAGALLFGALLVAGTVEVTMTMEQGTLLDPWCNHGPGNGGTVEGTQRIGRAIAKDMILNVPDEVPVLITNFNLTTGRLDSAVSTGFALTLAGWPRERFYCCRAGSPPPVWYVVVDLFEPEVDYLGWGRLEGVDVLMHRPEVGELLVAIRTPEALALIGEQLCGAIPPDRVVAVHYHEDLLNLLEHDDPQGFEELEMPPSPVPPCIKRMQ